MHMRESSSPRFLAPAMVPMVERFAERIRMDAELDRLVLPSVPDAVLAARKVVRDPDTDLDDVARAIARDPALAARVLRVANSPAFAGVSACSTLQAAVVRLGGAVIENVMLMLAVARVFSVGRRAAIQPHLSRLWAHSARVAGLSDALVDEAPHLQRDVAVLTGMVHGIGAVPLLVKAQEFPTLFGNPVLLEHLLERLQAPLGKVVLERWNAPAELIEAVVVQADRTRDLPGPADYGDVILVASLVSRMDPAAPDATCWSLPACRKFALDASDLPELLARAAEREAALSASVAGD